MLETALLAVLDNQKNTQMTKDERILNAISNDKEIQKKKPSHVEDETILEFGKRYIQAIKEGRMIVSIGSVSSSGMSRTMKFLECKKVKGSSQYNYLNFWSMFVSFGYTKARSNQDYFSISGCGMDMVFHTNYTNIHKLHRLGFISRKECDKLAQMTPSVI